jgi:hypothetical protein
MAGDAALTAQVQEVICENLIKAMLESNVISKEVVRFTFWRTAAVTEGYLAVSCRFCEPTRTLRTGFLADGVRFELTVSLHPRRFSRPVP